MRALIEEDKSQVNLYLMADQFFLKLVNVIFLEYNPTSMYLGSEYRLACTIVKIFKYLCEEHNNFFQEIFTILQQVVDDGRSISDVYLSYVLLRIVKYIHDGMLFQRSSYSNSNNKEVGTGVEDLIVKMIDKTDFGFDYEGYFNYLCEVRSGIFEMQKVIERVLIEVQRICYGTFSILGGKNTKKSLRFVKVCVAFCQITIPSIKSKERRVGMFVDTAAIALSNNLISEADSIMKNAVTVISEILEESLSSNTNKDKNQTNIFSNGKDRLLLNQIKKLISLLIVLPGNPDSPFQIISGLINTIGAESANTTNTTNTTNNSTFSLTKAKKQFFTISVSISSLIYLTTQLQITLPYHVQNLDSNDEIFCGDQAYMEEGLKLIELLVGEVLGSIELLTSWSGELKKEKMVSLFSESVCEFRMVSERFAKMSKAGKKVIERIDELGKWAEKSK